MVDICDIVDVHLTDPGVPLGELCDPHFAYGIIRGKVLSTPQATGDFLTLEVKVLTKGGGFEKMELSFNTGSSVFIAVQLVEKRQRHFTGECL